MKLSFAIPLFVLLTLVTGESQLIGRKDGHEPHDKPPIGRPDGHENHDPKLIGENDGHDFVGKPWIGGNDGHERTKKPPIGENDGHDVGGNPSIGEDDGHEGTTRKLIGKPDGHDWSSNKENLGLDKSPDVDESTSVDESLVRCKRPHCDEVMSCPFGPQTNLNGCPTCKCLKDPCKDVSCEMGYMCDPLECPATGLCQTLEYRCIPKRCNGPEPMCSSYCPYGYRLNEHGCTTCVCRILPTFKPSMNDEDDYVDGDDDDDQTIYDELDREIPESDDDVDDDNIDDDVMSEDGETCDEARCRKNEICEQDWKYPGDIDGEKTNRICMVKTRCWAMLNEPQLYPNKKPERKETCDYDWTFEPLQCINSIPNRPKICWCVNDLGDKIDGTMTTVYAEEQKPICERNSVISVTSSMQFKVVKSGSVSHNIVEMFTKELSKVTFAPMKSVRVLSVNYPELPVDFTTENLLTIVFILKSDPNYDLPYALDLLYRANNMAVNSDLYQVTQFGPPKVTYYQFSLPASPTPPMEDESNFVDPLPDYVYDRHRMNHSLTKGSFINKPFLITCLVILSGLILAVLFVIIILARRNYAGRRIRHQPLQNQLNIPADTENFINNPLKSESVVLVSDDVLNKVRDSSLA